MLGLGVFFLALYTTHASTANSPANVTVLFGSIFGISARAAVTATWIAAVLILVLLVIARPLLFASLDPAVAAARGVPVRLLGPLFLAVVGATAGRGHPGRRCAAAVRAARRATRRRTATHQPALARPGAVGRLGCGCGLGRASRSLTPRRHCRQASRS